MVVKNQIEDLLAQRTNLIDLVVTGIAIAFGVNILAAGIIAIETLGGRVAIGVGSTIIVLSAIYFASKSARRLSRRVEIFGSLFFDTETLQMRRVERYGVSEHTHRYMKAIFSENPAIENIWKSQNLKDIKYQDMAESPQRRIIVEALEYYVLDRMSTHLTDYFNSNDYSNNISILERNDIPSNLLANRFLELFSRPMEDREAFSKINTGKGPWVTITDGEGRIHSAYGPKGEMFDLFVLKLPKSAKITRVKMGHINISTARMKMDIVVDFDGTGGKPVRHFDELYIGEPFPRINSMRCTIDAHVKFNVSSMLTASGWEYYRWVDSLLQTIEDESDFESFLERIGWDQALTNAHIGRTLSKLRQHASGKKLEAEPSAQSSPVVEPSQPKTRRKSTKQVE